MVFLLVCVTGANVMVLARSRRSAAAGADDAATTNRDGGDVRGCVREQVHDYTTSSVCELCACAARE